MREQPTHLPLHAIAGPSGGGAGGGRRAISQQRKLMLVLLAGALMVTGLLATAWGMSLQADPAYQAYRQHLQQADPAITKLMADAIGDGLMASLGDGVDTTPGKQAAPLSPPVADPLTPRVEDLGHDDQGRPMRKVHLTAAQVNAWLGVHFRDWLAYRDYHMPATIHDPMLAFGPQGDVTMHFTYQGDHYTQAFQAQAELVMQDDGNATLLIRKLQAGRLPMPVDRLGQVIALASDSSAEARQAGQWLDKLQAVSFKPAVKLPDGLKAHLVGYAPQADGIDLTLRVERYRPPGKASPQSAARADGALK